jgi:phosphoribosylformylglycinamidine (FGAM) synthase PurS component
MPNFNVMINRTRTVEDHVELTISAKSYEAAEEKASERVQKALNNGTIDKAFDWEEDNQDSDFEYDISED